MTNKYVRMDVLWPSGKALLRWTSFVHNPTSSLSCTRRHSGAQWLSAQSQKDGGNTGDIRKKMAVQLVVHVRGRVLVSIEGAAIKVRRESQSNEGSEGGRQNIKVVTEVRLGRPRRSEGKCKSNHHLGLFLCGSDWVEVSAVSVCFMKTDNASARRVKSGLLFLYIYMYFFYSTFHVTGMNWEEHEKKGNLQPSRCVSSPHFSCWHFFFFLPLGQHRLTVCQTLNCRENL